MSTQPDPVRQNIVDWCQEDDIPCVIAPDAPNFAWVLQLGRAGHTITIYKTTQHDDRIYIQSQISFGVTHRTLVNQTWNSQQRNNMTFNIRKLAVQYDCNLNFQLNGDEVIGINTFKIHFHATISKSELLEKHVRMESIHNILLNQLNIELGIALQNDRTNQNQDNANTGR